MHRLADAKAALHVLSGLLIKPELTADINELLPWPWAGERQPTVDALRRAWIDGVLPGDAQGNVEVVLSYMTPEEAERQRPQELVELHFGNAAKFKPAVEALRHSRMLAEVQRALEGYDQPDDDGIARERVEQLRDTIDHALLEVSGASKPTLSVRDIIDRPSGIAEQMAAEDDGSNSRVSTGLPDLDSLLVGGTTGGQLIVVGARPSVGKSVLGLQMAAAAATPDRSSLLLSLEMGHDEVGQRALAFAGASLPANGASVVGFERRSPGAVEEAREAAASLEGLLIDCPTRPGIDYLRARAKQVRAKHGLRCLVVDYVSADMLALPGGMTRFEGVSHVTGQLKILARELSVPVIALTQLNRQAADATPNMAHLRDSGSFEQDADIVLLLHRTDDGTELHVAKNRSGRRPGGPIKLRFNATRMRFESLSPIEPLGVTYTGGGISTFGV